MDKPKFSELPFSFRISQGAMLGAIGALMASKKLFVQQWPMNAKWVIGSVICVIAFSALLTSSYVVIRYPYLSLVSTSDGNIFERQFTSRFLSRLLKLCSLLALIVILLVLGAQIAMNNNAITAAQIALMAYSATLFCFVIFLTFFYDAELHPTVATFVHATLGIGILFIPIFIPVLFVGSIRCKWLLNSVQPERERS